MAFDSTTILIILTAAVVAVTALGVYFTWRQWKKTKEAAPAAPMSHSDLRSEARATVENRVEVHTPPPLVVAVPSAGPIDRTQNAPARKETRKPPRAKKPGIKQQIIFEDSIEIEPGGYEPIYEDLNEGDVIRGIATERDSDPFNVYVMDEENYADFCNGDEFDYEFGDESVGSSRIEFTAPSTDTYYVVFDASDWRSARELSVRLKRIREG